MTPGESSRDEDLGSGGPLILPDFKDASGNTSRLAVGAGKDSRTCVSSALKKTTESIKK